MWLSVRSGAVRQVLLDTLDDDDDLRDMTISSTLTVGDEAGGSLRTTTQPTFNRRTESARLHEHSP